MGIQQRNLFIVFRELQPEMLFKSISDSYAWNSVYPAVSVSEIGSEIFQGLAHTQYPSYSYEEIEGIHQLLQEHMKPVSKFATAAPSVFMLLVRMGKRVFREERDGLVCNFSQVLAWQNVYQKLGQDLFTTAFLAHEDMHRGYPVRTEFAWDAILRTDNGRLNAILQQGIAENHCHLGGTTQNFSLSWACLMNYPHTIRLAIKELQQNLQVSYSRGIIGNVWPWENRLLWASYLRIELFKRLENTPSSEFSMNMESQCFYPILHIKRELRYLRSCYAAQVPQKGGSAFVLDYALRSDDCKNGLLKKHNRLLSGERSFLYRCFRACFDGTFSEDTQNWFYMYLLIKENFRAELVQVNHQAGFKNFKDYQDRKDRIYDAIAGYHAEAVRLSINANQQSQHIVSFEVRIAPKSSAAEMCQQVQYYEEQIKYSGGIAGNFRHLYVYHFIKNPDHNLGRFLNQPRNKVTRNTSCQNAKALKFALQHSQHFCNRVWGIDAANIEIDCRPETFATDFRYLKDTKSFQRWSGFLDLPSQPHVHTTYHVGEDFRDIVDGLRAIDEAVKFLNLDRGDRLGHALALGVEPSLHYRFKNRRVVLPKQDILDNVVWLLYRSQELNVPISPQLRSSLQTMADCYLSELYGVYLQENHRYTRPYEYYCSMQLRGDAPELYYVLPYEGPKPLIYDSYDRYKEDPREELGTYRSSDAISSLCQRYHYDGNARKKGREVAEFLVTEDYIELVRNVQDGLARELMEKGLMIECNPTSNYLIGTFRRYDAHPIFRFNNAGLCRIDGTIETSAQLSVSINTDDLGVFDTSLANEYAVLAASLERCTVDHNRKYSSDSIYDYLDRIRKMGIEQSFLLSKGNVDVCADGDGTEKDLLSNNKSVTHS